MLIDAFATGCERRGVVGVIERTETLSSIKLLDALPYQRHANKGCLCSNFDPTTASTSSTRTKPPSLTPQRDMPPPMFDPSCHSSILDIELEREQRQSAAC
jgi:hypothetical protein